MRQGEILNLQSKNIFKSHIELKARQTKSGHGRKIPINSKLQAELLDYLDDKKEIEQVFAIKSIRRAWNTAVRRAKLEDFRFHDLRRTFATWLKDSDVHIHTISTFLGHCNIKMTEWYLPDDINKMREAVEKLNFT